SWRRAGSNLQSNIATQPASAQTVSMRRGPQCRPRGIILCTMRETSPSGRLVMAPTFRKLHPHFVAEASPIDLRQAHDGETLDAIRAGMDEYAVLIFRDQPFSDAEQLAFAQRFDGTLHTNTGAAVLGKNRFGNEALTDISNLDD